MRIIKQSVDKKDNECGFDDRDITEIIGEVINITFNKTFYENGKLLDSPLDRHNVYYINDNEYEFYPTYGDIYILDSDRKFTEDEYKKIIDMFGSKFNEMYVQVKTAFKKQFIECGCRGTTQHMVLKSKDYMNRVSFATVSFSESTERQFMWYIQGNSMSISGINETVQQLASVSSVVFDVKDIIGLPHRYRQVDFPYLTQFRAYQEGLLYEGTIKYSMTTKLMPQIAAEFGKESSTFSECKDEMSLMKWEDVECCSRESYCSPIEQIKKCIFRMEKPNETLTCFLTGIPIYEDFYLVQLLKGNVELTMNRSEFQSKYTENEVTITNIARVYKTPIKEDKEEKKDKKKKAYKAKKADKVTLHDKHYKEDEDDEITFEILKKFDKPVYIALSPWSVHYGNALATFDEYKMYRSFCPRTLKNVIDSLKTTDLRKKVYHSINKKLERTNLVTMSNEEVELTTSNINVMLLMQFKHDKIIGNISILPEN